MNEKTARLLEMVKENPELPIVPMVDGEIVAGDEFATWMGAFGYSRVDHYVIGDDGMVCFKSNGDVFDVLERCLSEEEFDALPENEGECRPAYDALPWVKAIIVDIVLPD